MTNRKELLESKEYWVTQMQLQLYEELRNYMQANELTQSQLADKLGVTKGYVSQILNGDFDHKISKLVELYLAIGKVPIIGLENLNDKIEAEKSTTKAGKDKFSWAA